MSTPDSNPITWTADLATGISEIDEQHQILVNTLNDANRRLTDDSPADLLEQITRDLLSYALYHFETEEQLMEDSGYLAQCPQEGKNHLDQHRAFSAKVVEIRNHIKSGGRVPRDELLAFLNTWLVSHILDIDRRFARFSGLRHPANR